MGLKSANSEDKVFKKVNIILVIFLSIITVGIYIGYWFLNRKKDIKQLREQNYIPFKWWYVFTIFLSVSLLYQIFGGVFLTELGLSFFDSLDVIFSFFFLAILYYSVFRLRDLLEDEFDEENFNFILLVLFHIWYMQYKINRLDKAGRALL
ncbi:hypothetical protein AN964_18470 [Heyndrickxia shackletonii]|uniref:DUF4234 domain-containing protein n=1 Tax=Heyndrickxia shackletonii TaxID=157838 RepID=A0A0Q3TAD6_9BACI|nr:DUF4234 domain-containing protein [Heyndrickxia shackletonii]KQL51014.1 hypothetical protein AN964_18470 [Heyndrickxia shackletonii]NEZ02022.1 DUF4234 domain-containing protein [Heyndrickxia shackletonii]